VSVQLLSLRRWADAAGWHDATSDTVTQQVLCTVRQLARVAETRVAERGSRMRELAVALGTAVLLVAPAFAAEKPEDAAQVAAESWLRLVDHEPCDASWEQAAKPLKVAISKDEWTKACEGARQRIGKVVSRKLKSRQYTEHLPELPDGRYVVMQYESVFEQKPSVLETVTAMVDFDATWRVSGYFAH
jgi:hypothetical protein